MLKSQFPHFKIKILIKCLAIVQIMLKAVKVLKVLVTQSCLMFCDPMDWAAHKAPLSMGFSRQEYWSGLPFPSPGDLPDSGIEPRSPALCGFFTVRG